MFVCSCIRINRKFTQVQSKDWARDMKHDVNIQVVLNTLVFNAKIFEVCRCPRTSTHVSSSHAFSHYSHYSPYSPYSSTRSTRSTVQEL